MPLQQIQQIPTSGTPIQHQYMTCHFCNTYSLHSVFTLRVRVPDEMTVNYLHCKTCNNRYKN